MPYIWTDPAIFLTHNDVTIYHINLLFPLLSSTAKSRI